MNISHILRLLSDGKSLEDISIECAVSVHAIKDMVCRLAVQQEHRKSSGHTTCDDTARTDKPKVHDSHNKKNCTSDEGTIIITDHHVKGAVTLYTDGGSSGNPGPSGIGCVVFDDKGHTVAEGYKYIGIATNNGAEYQALLFGLTIVQQLKGVEEVACYTDSELMARQIQGKYKISDEKLRVYYQAVWNTSKQFRSFHITHVPREQNQKADMLARHAIKEAKAHTDNRSETRELLF